jgi:hypothetical protein
MILVVSGDLSELLPVVFTLVDIAVLVPRRDPVRHAHDHAPTVRVEPYATERLETVERPCLQ